MSDWIEHNGGPQPVADDVWVEVQYAVTRLAAPAEAQDWSRPRPYRIINQHLIDAKQAEIDALREDIAVWNSVFPDLLPDRLKSDKQIAEEDVAIKIDAARLEGIRLGLEAAAREANKWQIRSCDWFVDDAIRLLAPETITREAVLDKLASEAQEQGMGYETEADQ